MFGLVWPGLVMLGQVWFGQVWLGQLWFGLVWLGFSDFFLIIDICFDDQQTLDSEIKEILI